MTRWERWSPFSRIFGRLMVNNLQEQVKKKMKAPKLLTPSASKIDMGIIERFHEHQDIFMDRIAGCDQVDLDKIILTSPIIKFITYSLRDTIKFLVQHEHRHINQAIRVKQSEGFTC
jgi:hypothetical protein